MQADTIFRLYSMTKPIASVALMILYEEGRFQLRDPLSEYIPEFASLRVLRRADGALDDTVPLDRAPTIQDVLRHTAGFTHGASTDAYDAQYTKANVFGLDVSLAELMNTLSEIPLRYQPGTKFVYSLGPDVQARLVEVLSGVPFDEFLERRLFKPLGMKDAGFWVPPDKAERLATVYSVRDGKVMAERLERDSHSADDKRKGGSFGLVSTAEDYLRFAQMLLNGGELDGTRILGTRVVRYMARDHLGAIGIQNPNGTPSGMGWGLGFAVAKDPVVMGSLISAGTFYGAGAAATYFWMDPTEDMVVVAMTQHMGAPWMEMLRAQIPTLVYSALMD
jgi:CubicO group peptidase (beta-lactamase class C family)